MIHVFRFRAALMVALLSLPVTAGIAAAQSATPSFDDQARAILKLYDAGQKDSAYAMVEPLKRKARFSPAILYTRARLTSDDRALPLFKEVIALAPTGPWADEAAYQLVRRYADKRDSMATQVWLQALKTGYAGSSYIASADELVASIKNWEIDVAEVAEKGSKDEKVAKPVAKSDKVPVAKDVKGEKPAVPPAKSEKPTTKPANDGKEKDAKDVKAKDAKEAKEKDAKESAHGEKELPKSTTRPAETYKGSGMKGYALQLGLFPTRKAADEETAELKKKNIRSRVLPKVVKGKTQYALVVGPYESVEEAKKKRATLASSCNCQAFVVEVQ